MAPASRLARFFGTLFAFALASCGEPPADPPTNEPLAPETETHPPEVPAVPIVPPRPLPPSRIEARGPYQADVGRDCDGLPYLPLTTLRDQCVGIALSSEVPAVAAARGPFRPRTIVEDPTHDNVMWVVDHGARRERAGRVWKITPNEAGGFDAVQVLERLDRPHQVRVGPDGFLYVGEVQRIIRFDPASDDIAGSVERVIEGLPFALPDRPVRFHPLKAFVFTPGWDLILNMGSGTDRCLESITEPRCRDEAEHTAAIWRYRYLGDRRWATEPEYLAEGLRNSVALATHASGTILQGENAADFPEEDRPHEELNVIQAGRHYGWPYCFDRDQRDTEWMHANFSCDTTENTQYEPPQLLLPPHGAPLDMLFYRAARLEGLTGRLLISLHGYRAPGHRVLGYDVDARGIPAADAQPVEIIAGWEATDNAPRGTPVGMTEARDGSLWLVEDNNGTVLRLSTDAYGAARRGEVPDADAVSEIAGEEFVDLHREVLAIRCSRCHTFVTGDPNESLAAVRREGWLRDEDGHPAVYHRTRQGAERAMPPDGPLTAPQRVVLDRWLSSLGDSP